MKIRSFVLCSLLVAVNCKPEPPTGYRYPAPPQFSPFPNPLPEVVDNRAINPCTACQLSKFGSSSNSGEYQIPSRTLPLPPSRSYGIPVLPEQPVLRQTAYTTGFGNSLGQSQALTQPTAFNSNAGSSAQVNFAPGRQYLSPGFDSGFSQSPATVGSAQFNYASSQASSQATQFNTGSTNGAQVNYAPNRQYLTPVAQNLGPTGDLQASIQNNFPTFANAPQEVGPETIQKHIYVHVAPPDEEQQRQQAQVQALARQKHYKIIFIKTPTYENQAAQIRAAQQAQNEEKTLVYVLVKKPDAPEDIVIPTAAPTQPSKPEVYFIKYKSKTEALSPRVPAQIQQQPDSVVVDAPINSNANANAQASTSASASASANASSGFSTYGAPSAPAQESVASGPYKK